MFEIFGKPALLRIERPVTGLEIVLTMITEYARREFAESRALPLRDGYTCRLH
jgi:hypothetical protein